MIIQLSFLIEIMASARLNNKMNNNTIEYLWYN